MISGSGSTLSGFLETYCLERQLSPQYEERLHWSVRQFEQFAGRRLTLHDLSDRLVNEWAAELRRSGMSPKTIRNKVFMITGLWRAAWDQQQTLTRPERIVRVKLPDQCPVAWSREELARLLNWCEHVRGHFATTGIKKSDFWVALVLTFYDTALRLGDVFALKRSDFVAAESGGARAQLVQHKTGRLHVVGVSDITIERINRLGPFDVPHRGGLIFWWPADRRGFHKAFKKVITESGLDTSFGASRRIRRSSATAIEIIAPGKAGEHLGHSSGQLIAKKFYIDRSKTPLNRPLPPGIDPF